MADDRIPKGQLSIRVVAMPANTNSSGDIFGGWLVSQMDLAGMCESTRRCRSRVATVVINNMNFIKPVSVGDTVCCYTELVKVGTTSMTYKIECWVISLVHTAQVMVAEGEFIYVALDANRKPHSVDRII